MLSIKSNWRKWDSKLLLSLMPGAITGMKFKWRRKLSTNINRTKQKQVNRGNLLPTKLAIGCHNNIFIQLVSWKYTGFLCGI